MAEKGAAALHLLTKACHRAFYTLQNFRKVLNYGKREDHVSFNRDLKKKKINKKRISHMLLICLCQSFDLMMMKTCSHVSWSERVAGSWGHGCAQT